MCKNNKIEQVCRFCPYSLGCSESCISDDVTPDECHTCVYKHPLDELGYVQHFDND